MSESPSSSLFPIPYWGSLYSWQHIDFSTFIEERNDQLLCNDFAHRDFNRTLIKSVDGRIIELIIPLQSKDNIHFIKDAQIAHQSIWAKKHLQMLQSCYGKCTFWEEYKEDIAILYNRKISYLIDFNYTIIDWQKKFISQDMTSPPYIHQQNDELALLHFLMYQF